MTKHYAPYSEAWGIFLGVGYWSLKNHGGRKQVPTFPSVEIARAALTTWNDSAGPLPKDISVPPDVRFIEIFPDLPGGYASIEACANLGLPRWNPEEEIVNKSFIEKQLHPRKKDV